MRFKLEEPSVDNGGVGEIEIKSFWQGRLKTFVFPCVFVVADGFEDFNLCVHKSPTFHDDWAVSHIETGFAVANGDSLEEAMVLAAARLATKSKDDMHKAIEKARATLNEQAPSTLVIDSNN